MAVLVRTATKKGPQFMKTAMSRLDAPVPSEISSRAACWVDAVLISDDFPKLGTDPEVGHKAIKHGAPELST